MAGFVDTPRRLAIPLVCALIAILAYGSQLLFARAGASRLPPGPLTRREFLIFNGSLLCLWWTYYRACTVGAGRYRPLESAAAAAASAPSRPGRPRWCSRCRAPKPARAHHCRRCGRCIPRMDHHCPWIGNCVSLTTFPHFLRFLAWATAALLQLCGHLWARGAALWAARDLPAYLGPTAGELAGFGLLAVGCAQVTVMMVITLAAVVLGSARNQTMIEDFELSRHHALLARGADWWWSRGGEDEGEGGGGDGAPAVEPTEFPYDIGVFHNLAQAMGTKNPLWWLFPLAGAPELDPDGTGTGIGWTYPENGLNRRVGMWPPYDPDKAGRRVVGWPGGAGRIRESGWGRGKGGEGENRLGETMRDFGVDEGDSGPEHESGSSSSHGYRDAAEDGKEESDHDDDDDVLIGELIRRRAHTAEAGGA